MIKRLILGFALSTVLGLSLFYMRAASVLGDYIGDEKVGESARRMIESDEGRTYGYYIPIFSMIAACLVFMFVWVFLSDLLLNKLKLREKPYLYLPALLLVGAIPSAAILLSIEPYIAMDSVEYGVRQDWNFAFEKFGYTLVNLYMYLVPLSGALLFGILTVTQRRKADFMTDPEVLDA